MRRSLTLFVLVVIVCSCVQGIDEWKGRRSVAVVFCAAGGDERDLREWSGFEHPTGDSGELSISLFCIDCTDNAVTTLQAILQRYDSYLVVLGSGLLPAIRAVAGTGDGMRLLWLGMREPEPPLPPSINAWWADPDSLIATLAAHAVEELDQEGGLVVIGSLLRGTALRALIGADITIQVVEPEQLSPGTRSLFAAYPGRPVLVVEPPLSMVALAGSKIYWGAECPFAEPHDATWQLVIDWEKAVQGALEWAEGHGGVSPGETLGRWLFIEHRGDGDSHEEST